jgi:RNA polymerase sigma factor (sigma-70 family)
MSPVEENRIIDQVLAGREDAYSTLVEHYQRFAFTIAFKILENRNEAEEAAQDAFIKAFHYLKGFNREARFSTWLYRIVFNTAVSYKRKHKMELYGLENNDRAGETTSSLEKADKQVFVAQAMKHLNEADRLAIQLYYIQEFSLDEVAETMGQNTNTLKVRIHRARQRLADELKKLLKEEALTL